MIRLRHLVPLALLPLSACQHKPADADADGYTDTIDCNDDDPDINPGAEEQCDELDNDCDGAIDAADEELVGAVTAWPDDDGDGYGTGDPVQVCALDDSHADNDDDCDDGDDAIHPDAAEVCGDGQDNDCSAGDVACPTAALPVAPSPSQPMWPGVQTAFVDGTGAPCAARISVGMGDQATCFTDGGALQCAGRVYTQTYGDRFTSTGLTGVDQVQVTLTSNVANGNTAYALVEGVPQVLGYFNVNGQLGNGGTASNTAWTPWVGGITGAVGFTTGTTDSWCAMDGAARVWCTGHHFGTTPALVDAAPHTSVRLDTFGTVHLDDVDVWRVSQGRASCEVQAAGLICGSLDPLGRAGRVVDGGMIDHEDSAKTAVVWLEDDGLAWRAVFDHDVLEETTPLLASRPLLLIGYNLYSDSVCGVHDDGSLDCIGSNTEGKLGTGDDVTVTSPRVVMPAGTFDLTCR